MRTHAETHRGAGALARRLWFIRQSRHVQRVRRHRRRGRQQHRRFGRGCWRRNRRLRRQRAGGLRPGAAGQLRLPWRGAGGAGLPVLGPGLRSLRGLPRRERGRRRRSRRGSEQRARWRGERRGWQRPRRPRGRGELRAADRGAGLRGGPLCDCARWLRGRGRVCGLPCLEDLHCKPIRNLDMHRPMHANSEFARHRGLLALGRENRHHAACLVPCERDPVLQHLHQRGWG
jgi:hypothetical protein